MSVTNGYRPEKSTHLKNVLLHVEFQEKTLNFVQNKSLSSEAQV